MRANITPRITDLSHRVALCSMNDVVVDGATMELTRHLVTWAWALIHHQPNLPSFIAPGGYAIKESTEKPTHRIVVRAAVDLEITSKAWVYEERRRSPPRWYKILGFTDDKTWLVLTCHLVERSEKAQPPAGIFTAPPAKVLT